MLSCRVVQLMRAGLSMSSLCMIGCLAQLFLVDVLWESYGALTAVARASYADLASRSVLIMFLVDWMFGLLSMLGLHHKKGKVLFLGLDNAGKTTLLAKLKDDRNAVCEPTVHPNSEVLQIGKLQITTFDMGGHKTARKLWHDYFGGINGVVYIVDCADQMRFQESKSQLQELLSDEQLAEVPFLILGNKIDISGACSEEELRMQLGVHGTTGKDAKKTADGERAIEIFMCSVVKKYGYQEGFKWLTEFI